MRDTKALYDARIIAEHYIKTSTVGGKNAGSHGLSLSEDHFEYQLTSKTKAYEFSLLRKHKESGYVIVSGDRTFAPILEWSPQGASL